MSDLDKLMDSGTVETVGDLLNPLAVVGSNNPPEPTPYEACKQEIEDLYGEAKNWLDGEPIGSSEDAAQVGKIRDLIRAAKKRADDARKVEAKPFDDGKAEVQARYNPLIKDDTGTADRAIKTCNAALAPWLKRVDDEQRAEAERQRAIADKAAADALEAAKVAAGSGNLEHRERTEDLLAEAKGAVSTMKAAEKAKAQVRTGVGRAIGMKSVYVAELTDAAAAIEHYRKTQPKALKEWMMEQAAKDIRVGPKPPAHIPGFTIREDRVPA